jgi:4-amino-4-deoxy-L-arabinose transferase-like glycosyltransferase
VTIWQASRTEPGQHAAEGTSSRLRLLRGLRADWSVWVLLVLVVGAFALHVYHLGHTYIGSWDEVFHAVVALHLAQHPLQPTLYDIAALTPPTALNWNDTHIWLHIPPVGMWSAALSMRVLGYTPFAMRLPGLLFVVAGMGVTYVLGRRLYGPAAGLAGAAFTGFVPYTLLLGQGYVFGDMTDTPLLLLTPLTVLGLVLAYRSGRIRWLVLAGAAEGLCYLTKGNIGLAPIGIALVLYACEWLFPRKAGWHRLGLRGLATFLGSAVLVAVPYTIYTARAFPASYAVESRNWSTAFSNNYEHWGRPIDYHLTLYFYALYGPALALLLVTATVTLAIVAVRSRSRADMIVVVWILAFYVPLTIAETKAVPMTIAVVPALGLAAARLISLGLASRTPMRSALTLGLVLGTALASLGFLAGNMPQISAAIFAAYTSNTPATFGTPATIKADVMSVLTRAQPYALELGATLIAAALCASGLWLARRLLPGRPQDTTGAPLHSASRCMAPWLLARGEPIVIALVLGVSILALGATWLRYDWTIVGRPADTPGPMPVLGKLVAQWTPTTATVLFYDTRPLQYNANFALGFWAHRDVYPADIFPSGTSVCSLARTTSQHGSPLYVLTREPYSGPSLGSAAGWTLYAPDCPAQP